LWAKQGPFASDDDLVAPSRRMVDHDVCWQRSSWKDVLWFFWTWATGWSAGQKKPGWCRVGIRVLEQTNEETIRRDTSRQPKSRAKIHAPTDFSPTRRTAQTNQQLGFGCTFFQGSPLQGKKKLYSASTTTTMKIIVSPDRFSSFTAIIPSSIALLLLLQAIALLPAAAAAASATWPSSSRSVLATIRHQTASAAAASRSRGRALFGIYNNNNKMELLPMQWARSLQANSGGAVCAPTDGFDEDEDNALRKFDTSFSPVCRCDGDSFDLGKYFDENPFPSEDSSLLDQWIEDFADYGRNLVTDEQHYCRNECSVCTSEDSPCLILEETGKVMFRGSLNLTLDDIITIQSLPYQEASDFLDGKSRVFLRKNTLMQCYMAEGSASGKVCLSVTIDLSSDVGVSVSEIWEEIFPTVECAVSVDGVACTSCIPNLTTSCLVADCTNIAGNSSARIDTCNADRASFPGVFGPLYDLEAKVVTYTVGRCDDDGNSSTPPPSTLSNVAPVETPVAMSAPTAAPAAVLSPALAPASSSLEPVPVSSPGTLPGSAPVSSPASSPVSSTVSSPRSVPVLSPPPPFVPATDSGAVAFYYRGGRSVLTLVLVSSAYAALMMIP
jgi:hypothetical protein